MRIPDNVLGGHKGPYRIAFNFSIHVACLTCTTMDAADTSVKLKSFFPRLRRTLMPRPSDTEGAAGPAGAGEATEPAAGVPAAEPPAGPPSTKAPSAAAPAPSSKAPSAAAAAASPKQPPPKAAGAADGSPAAPDAKPAASNSETLPYGFPEPGGDLS